MEAAWRNWQTHLAKTRWRRFEIPDDKALVRPWRFKLSCRNKSSRDARSPQSGGERKSPTPAPAILPHGVVETRQTLTLESKVRTLVWQQIQKHSMIKSIIRHAADTIYYAICLLGCLLAGVNPKEVFGGNKNRN